MNRFSILLSILLIAAIFTSCHSDGKVNGEKASTSSNAQEENLEPGPDCTECGPSEAPGSLTSAISIAGKEEPGQRLILSGRVFYAGTRTPAPGVMLYVYHTNAKGIYPQQGNETGQAKWHGHLRGWLRTDGGGNYLISTIKPGAYPGRTDPAHIHVIVKQGDQPAYYVNDFMFEGDSLLTAEYRKNLDQKNSSGIIGLGSNSAGILTGYRDIILPK
jgi:protocatechuate 3,4-dioxygenase beta subunit